MNYNFENPLKGENISQTSHNVFQSTFLKKIACEKYHDENRYQQESDVNRIIR